MRGEIERAEVQTLLPVAGAYERRGVSEEAFRQAETLHNRLVRYPESEAFGNPEWKDLPPMVQRFAALALRFIDPAELSDQIAPPRARISCRHCRDLGLTFGEFKGTKDNPGCVSPLTGRRETVAWFCMECPRGLRRCAAFWAEKLKYRSGEEEYRQWTKANPVEARRVDAVDRTQEGTA